MIFSSSMAMRAQDCRLIRFEVSGFRSIRHAVFEFGNLNMLVGRNGSGKSNLLQVFDMLGWMVRGKQLQEYVAMNGGADNLLFNGSKTTGAIKIELNFQTSGGTDAYCFRLRPTADNTLIFGIEAYYFLPNGTTNEPRWTILGSGNREAEINNTTTITLRTLRFLLSKCSLYRFHDTSPSAKIKAEVKIGDEQYLRNDGANLASVLLEMREIAPANYAGIVERVRSVVPIFKDFVLRPDNGMVRLGWNGHGLAHDGFFGPHTSSDGMLRFVALTTLLHLPPERLPKVLLLDTPELGLHPSAIEALATMIHTVSTDRQVIIATQSPLLVDKLPTAALVLASLEPDGATVFKTPNRVDYEVWTQKDMSSGAVWL